MRRRLWRASNREISSRRRDVRCARLSILLGDLLALEAALTAWSAASSVLSSGPQRTALVVDSGAQINELLDGVFASESWSVEHVPDNCAALLTAAANPFALIITGSRNQCPENLEVVHKIRAIRPHARLIILADQFTPGDVLDAMREGAFTLRKTKCFG